MHKTEHYDIIYQVDKHEPKGSIMAKKKRTIKSNLLVIDAHTVWQSQKPRYNGFACGHGAHGKRGYNRNAEKRKPLDW